MSVSLENYRQLPKHAGIYQIGQYIGSSINIRNRVRGHLKKLRAGKHTSALMQKAYDDEFSCIRVRVLEFVPARKRVNLVIREQHYFDLLKPKWNNTLFAHAPMQDPKIAARQSKSMINTASDLAYRFQHAERMRLVMQDPELKTRLSYAQKERYSNVEERAKTSRGTKKAMARPDVRKRFLKGIKNRIFDVEKLRDAGIARFADPEYRKKNGELVKAAMTPAIKAYISRKAKDRFRNPEERRKTAEKQREVWKNPEYREHQCKALSEGQKRGYLGEKGAERRKQLSIMHKRRWESMSEEDYRKYLEKIRERNRNPELRSRMSVSCGGSGVLLTPKQIVWVDSHFIYNHPKYGINPLAKKFDVGVRQIRKAITNYAKRNGKPYLFKGERVNTDRLCKLLKICRGTFDKFTHEGFSPREAIAKAKEIRRLHTKGINITCGKAIYEIDGEKHTLTSLCREYGIERGAFVSRIKRGLKPKEAVVDAQRHQNKNNKVLFRGNWVTLSHIATKHKISRRPFKRLLDAGMGIEDALTRSISEYRPRMKTKIRGEMLSQRGLCDKYGLNRKHVRAKLRKGMTIKEIMREAGV